MKLISQLPRFNTLQTKITLTFLVLILIIQATGYLTTRFNIERNARQQATSDLTVGERIFDNLISDNSKNLTQASKILAADYGFREAVSSKDAETIVSALDNYRGRISADIAMFHDAPGKYVASTTNENKPDAQQAIEKLIDVARIKGSATGLVILNDTPQQLVVLPVNAPLLTGWVTMGFAIDDALARRMHKLANLEVTFLQKNAENKWISVATTLDKPSIARLLSVSQRQNSHDIYESEINLNNTLYSTRFVKLKELGLENDHVVVVLQRSIDEATKPYKDLQLTLLLIALAGLIIFIAAGFYMATKISRPINEFAVNAKHFEKGDYSTVFSTNGTEEFANLGKTLNSMREAIAARERKITRLAYWDELTGLPNRAAFTESLEKSIEKVMSDFRSITIIVLDIDRFKQINLALGHAAGDEILKLVAHRIKDACYKKNTDIVARFAGDKFAIIMPNVTANIALSVAERILKTLEMPAVINEHPVDLVARMGLATFPNHANQVELLVSRAELAMYEAKRLQVHAVVYDSKLDVSKEQNIAFVSELKIAEEQNQFKFFVQPKIDLATNKIVAVESLIRWLNPQGEMVYPDQFIPQAEKTGQIAKITTWMLLRAASYYAEWKSYDVDVSIAINLSARDLMDPELPDRISRILAEKSVPPKAITLEITESNIMEDPKRAQMTVAQLSNMGLKISIDDFGTGYSSFAYLKNLQVNELKIDKSFIIDMTPNSEDIKIVRSTIDLAHNMGLKVVAEGIENKMVLELLKTMGCDYGQGYYIARPMPVEDFNDWLIDWETKDL